MAFIALTPGNDVFADDDEAHNIYAGLGNDTVWGMGGDDLLHGGQGDDLIFGGQGSDILRGGLGNDQLYSGSDFNDMRGGLGDDFIAINQGSANGGGGADWIVFGDLEAGEWSPGFAPQALPTTITGGAGADGFNFAAVIDEAPGYHADLLDFNAAKGDHLHFRLRADDGRDIVGEATIFDNLDRNDNGWIGLGDGDGGVGPLGWGFTAIDEADHSKGMVIHIAGDELAVHGVTAIQYADFTF